ncbi:MAG TPA: hypothetical protein VFV65_05000 [Gemmatimonadales bacterium]|nr:hypothetical protein [Gemmatimonadales bacterium]
MFGHPEFLVCGRSCVVTPERWKDLEALLEQAAHHPDAVLTEPALALPRP